jgi:hypothetical protein
VTEERAKRKKAIYRRETNPFSRLSLPAGVILAKARIQSSISELDAGTSPA